MKKIITSTFVLLIIVFIQVFAQEDLQKRIKTGFKTGNVKEFSFYLNSKTELAFDGEKKVLKKDKAEEVLQNFFLLNKPKDFQVLHQGASKEGLKFYIGEYVSMNGTYRVLVYMKMTVIETIDISKE